MPADADAWFLNPLHLEGLPDRIEIPRAGLTLGRDAGNDVVVPRGLYPGVSGHHARLVFDGERLLLEDLGSKNGTFVSGIAIERHELRSGVVFELGAGGPRFTVLLPAGSGGETLAMRREDLPGRGRSLGNETIALVREKLGIEAGAGVQQMLETRTRRQTGVLLSLLLLVTAGAGSVVWWMWDTARERAAENDSRVLHLEQQLEEARLAVTEQQQHLLRQAAALGAAQAAWESDRAKLEEEKERLLTTIGKLESGEQEASAKLEGLYAELEENRKALSRFDPIELERAKLDKVAQVEPAVVLVEATLVYADSATGRPMYVDTRADGRIVPNFDGAGTRLMTESTGSGFVVGDEGYVITNAHVVYKKGEAAKPIRVAEGREVVPQLLLDVVFSRSAERRRARLVRFAADGDDDLALLKIEPFEGMPFVPVPDFDVGLPPRGAEVFLLGFPLGKKALQQGDVVIASTFKGIVSRVVEPFLQVDAAVHPGNSGGPLIDGAGRVLGVVTAMQAVDEVAGSSAIGYIVPIEAARKIWGP